MNRKTNKTAHVLRLLASADGVIKGNPILDEDFKDEMILHRKTNDKPSVDEQEDVEIVLPKAIGVNIVSDLIEENLTSVLDRFRCCDCDKCRKQIMLTALNQIQPQYVDAETVDAEEIKNLKDRYKTSVVTVLVKVALQIKSNPIH